MGRLYCGHGVHVSTGGSSTGLLWEDCVAVMVSMCLLGALLLDYYGKTVVIMVFMCLMGVLLLDNYGKTVVVMVSMCLLGDFLLDYYGKTMLWSWCLCVYWGLYYWIIMGRLCCGHGVYVSTGGSTTGLLWEDCVVVMVSKCLLEALLLDYYGKTVLCSCCLCVYGGFYYWIIM